MKTVLTKRQTKTATRRYQESGDQFSITAKIRYDDECGNGHNTFAITADIKRRSANGRWVWHSGGCCHDVIAKRFPEFAYLIKWHLCGSHEPMHYLANTLYHVKEANYDHARSTAIWPNATDNQLADSDLEQCLIDRLPALMEAFQHDVAELGFVF